MTRRRFVRLALGCREDVYRLAGALCRDEDEAADVVQEAYARAFEAWRQLREERSARPWLLRIAHNVLCDRRRRARAVPELELVGEGPAAGDLQAEALARIEAGELARRMAEAMPEERRAALWLREGMGMSYAEIAEAIDCPIGTVRSRIARARADVLALARGGAADAGARRGGR